MATYNITDYDELQLMSSHRTDDCVLLNDIDAAASRTANEISGKPDTYYGFAPINNFQGNFDGQNFKIKNLYINRIASEYMGLFGKAQVNAASYYIKDVTLENCDIKGKNLTGALCGYVTNYDITNCHSSGTIEAGAGSTTSDKGVGGLIGMYEGEKTLTNCSSSCTVKAETALSYYMPIGGFIGWAAAKAGESSQYTNCTASGLVTATMDAGALAFYAGGFAGRQSGGTSNFDGCIATGDVTVNVPTTSATGLLIGGFIGAADGSGSTFETCFAYGDVTYSSVTATNAYVGGFAGKTSQDIDQCGAEGDVENASTDTTVNFSGGFVGLSISDINNCYARGNVCDDGIGHADANIGGFVGYYNTGTLDDCYSSGAVQTLNPAGTAAANGGGFMGVDAGGTETNCFWDMDTSGWTTSAGDETGEDTADMKTESTFTDAGWDFDAIWQLPTYTRAPGSGVTVWFSAVSDYEDFEEDVKDADAFSLGLPSTNSVVWIEALEALMAGTFADEWKIGSNELDTPITPTNFTVRQQTTYGSKQIQALKVNEVILFVDFVGRKLREMTYTEQQRKYVAPDLTSLAEHITASGITSMALQKNPDVILWVTLGDGSLISMTYDREQDVVAWSDYPMQTDTIVQSVAVIPQSDEDEIWMSVKRTMSGVNGGTFVIYIERMKSRNFGTDLDDAFFVDSGLTTTAPAASITLAHLIGETVAILADGVEMDTAVVGAGGTTAVKLNGVATNATIVQAGLQYTYKLQPMRPDVSGPGGTSHGSKVKVPEMVISFLNTVAARYGVSDSTLKDIDFTYPDWVNESSITGLFTGDIIVTVDGGFSIDNPLIISDDGPMPCTVRALVPRLDVTGR